MGSANDFAMLRLKKEFRREMRKMMKTPSVGTSESTTVKRAFSSSYAGRE